MRPDCIKARPYPHLGSFAMTTCPALLASRGKRQGRRPVKDHAQALRKANGSSQGRGHRT